MAMPGELLERIRDRARAELDVLRREFDERRQDVLARVSAHGLGTSGDGFTARAKLSLEQLDVEGRMLLNVEVETHRSERVGWTRAERDDFLNRLRTHLDRATRGAAEDIRAFGDDILLRTIGERVAVQVERDAQALASRLVLEAETMLAATNFEINEHLPTAAVTIDEVQLTAIPDVSHADLRKAVDRLATDPSGSISAACGAVDSATAEIYRLHHIGSCSNVPFHERVKHSLDAVGALDRLTHELSSLGWQQVDVDLAVKNFHAALKGAALFLQKVRPNMGDVHGSKPTSQAIAFQALRWAMSITASLKPAATPTASQTTP